MKRNGRFYLKNEKEVMEKYGLKNTPQSGAGWLIKEDGYNDNVIAQLKSTDASSYRLTLDDIDKLEYHALVENKIPLFIIEFLQRDERYFILRPKDLVSLYNYLTLPKNASDHKSEVQDMVELNNINIDRKVIKSSPKSRNKLNKSREEEYERRSEIRKKQYKSKVRDKQRSK